MRTLLILAVFCIAAIKTLQAPHVGVYLMSWIGYMNPHRMVHWSFVYTLPLAAIAFGITFVSYLLLKDKPKDWFSAPLWLIILLLVWGAICSYFAFYPDVSFNGLTRYFKVQLITFLTIMVIRSKDQIINLVWVIYLSIGFFGIKGGIFTLLTGGSYLVWGPEGTFIGGNNEVGLALLIALPMGYFLLQQYDNKWIRLGLLISLMLIVIAVIGTHSRGAFLALFSTGVFLWFKSHSKLQIAIIAFIGVLLLVPFIPQQWFDRMETIQNYEQDGSAMGRINAWNVAINIANDRITGGGFNHWGEETFNLYAPVPDDVHDAHSIYFEVLGEMGYPGLILFLLILASIWFGATSNVRNSIMYMKKNNSDGQEWIVNLNKMIQVSLVAYMTGGAFLGLAYWDLPYHLFALTICCGKYMKYIDDKNINRMPRSMLNKAS